MKYQINKALIQWNDAKADKEAIQQILTKVQDSFEPTQDEITKLETEINRERKFNTVSKLKYSLDHAQQANSRKFKARHKMTVDLFLKECSSVS